MKLVLTVVKGVLFPIITQRNITKLSHILRLLYNNPIVLSDMFFKLICTQFPVVIRTTN